MILSPSEALAWDFATRELCAKISKPIEIKGIGFNDLANLVKIDLACFGDDYDIEYDEEEFKEEIERPDFLGFIAYTTVNIAKVEYKLGIGYIMGNFDELTEHLVDETCKEILEQGRKGAYGTSSGVIPSLQRKGITSSLYDLFEMIASQRGAEYIRFHTRTAENPQTDNAYLFFQKKGFKITATIPDFYNEPDDPEDDYEWDTGDDAYEMVKFLSQPPSQPE